MAEISKVSYRYILYISVVNKLYFNLRNNTKNVNDTDRRKGR